MVSVINDISVREGLRRLAGDASRRSARTALLRALASHDDWIVPAALLGADGASVAEQGESLVLGGANASQGDTAYLFSDRDAVEAARAAGIEAGRLVTSVPGTQALRALGKRLDALEINPGSPSDAHWSVRHRHFPMLRLWSMTVATERALESATEAETKVALVREYPAWLVLSDTEGNEPRATTWRERIGQFALVFTAADQLAAYMGDGPAEIVRLRGDALLDQLVAKRFRGVVVNAALDAPCVVPLRPADSGVPTDDTDTRADDRPEFLR